MLLLDLLGETERNARLRDIAHPSDAVVLTLLAGCDASQHRANAHAKEADEDEHLVRVRVRV